MADKFVSLGTGGEVSGLSNVTRWRMEKRGEFPKRRQISPNRVAYLQSELFEWRDSRPDAVGEYPNLKRGESS